MKLVQVPRHQLHALPPGSVVHVDGNVELLNTFSKRVAFDATQGETLAVLMGRLTQDPVSAQVYLVGTSGQVYGPINPKHWARLRPKPGQRVVAFVVPGGGGSGSGGDKSAGRIVLQIVIIVVAMLIAYFVPGIGGVLLAMAWNYLANYALNQLMPPPTPGKLKGRTGERQRALESPVLGITGSQNRANPYGAVPVIYGQSGVYPPWRCG